MGWVIATILWSDQCSPVKVCGPQRAHLVVDSKQRDLQVKKKTSLLSFALGKVKRSCSLACEGLAFLIVTKGMAIGKENSFFIVKTPH